MQIERVRPLVISVSILGIICLYGYSLTLVPEDVTTAEVGEHEGQYVRLSGTVIDLSEFSDTTYLTLRDEYGTASVLVHEGNRGRQEQRKDEDQKDEDRKDEDQKDEDQKDEDQKDEDRKDEDQKDEDRKDEGRKEWHILVGDTIEVTGIVESNDGGYRVIVEKFELILLVERWDGITFTLAGLASQPRDLIGLNVNVTCRIRIPLTDSYGSAYAIIEDENNTNISLPVYVHGIVTQRGYRGKLVYITARFEYQEGSFRYCLIIDEPYHHIWTSEKLIA